MKGKVAQEIGSMMHALREVDAMTTYKSTTQLYNYNYSTTPTLQPDDVIASSSPARDLRQVRPQPQRVKDREKLVMGTEECI